MSLAILALVACFLASVPAVNVTVNLLFYRRTPRGDSHGDIPTPVSVVIPARDEEANIRNAASGVLSNEVGNLELLVIDDHSRDRTAEVVTEIARRDPRVRLVSAPALPADWAGKPHSCFAGAREAKGEILVFVDADVRLEQDAVGRLVAFMEETGSDLASGIPRQLTGTLMEKLVIPLIHFILLGFLPMMGMRWTRRPAFAAGCGQLFVARHQAYEQVGGHRAVKSSRHDGLQLPRAFRRQHLRTELFDATDLATCRMYRSASEVWRGFAKNATEGMATPLAILPWTLLLLAGQVLPPVLLLAAWLTHAAPPALALAAAATAMVFGTRLLLLWRFEQSVIGALLHPVGILAIVAIQWFALIRGSLGLPLAWKGRT